MGEWRPIKSAPKDGTEFLAFRKNGTMAVVRWRYHGWVIQGGLRLTEITHFMPLPDPPQ